MAALIARLKAAPTWNAINPAHCLAPFAAANRATRALVIRVVNAFVVRLREDAGLTPFDDAVPY